MTVNRSVALVGRPNVGKSRIFNRLVRRRISIVHDQPGVTRDVLSAEVDDDYTLLDTGGHGLAEATSSKEISRAVEEQVHLAVQAAGLILFVVDGKAGCAPQDEAVAELLRRSGKPVVLLVNKIDNDHEEANADDFMRLGFGDPVVFSAEHGRGEQSLRDLIAERLGAKPEAEVSADPARERIRICFSGRPNVGKSSLGNRMLRSDRLIVTDTPGTTRDAVELDLDYRSEEGKVWPFHLYDTAGVRKNTKLSSSVEYFSTVRTEYAIKHSEIVYLVLDAMDGVTKQDKTLAGQIVQYYRALIILVNKWDLALNAFENGTVEGYENEREFREAYAASVRKELFFNPDSPVLFVSALEGLEIERMLKAARKIHYNLHRRLPTSRLNKLMTSLAEKRPASARKGTRFRVYYAVQTGTNPITVRLFCNRAEKLDDPYRRYLESGVTREFSLEGCPVKFELVGKPGRGEG